MERATDSSPFTHGFISFKAAFTRRENLSTMVVIAIHSLSLLQTGAKPKNKRA